MSCAAGHWTHRLHEDLGQVLRLAQSGELDAAAQLFSRFDSELRAYAIAPGAAEVNQLECLQAGQQQVIDQLLAFRGQMQGEVSQLCHDRRGMDAYATSGP